MSKANASKRGDRVWQGADLVMEIVSPDDPARDWDVKRRDYAEAGIAEYWIVDPQKKSITVLRLEKSRLKPQRYKVHGEFKRGAQATSALLPGFAVNVSQALKPN